MGHPAPIICQIANFLCPTEREFLEFFKGHPTFACSTSKEELEPKTTISFYYSLQSASLLNKIHKKEGCRNNIHYIVRIPLQHTTSVFETFITFPVQDAIGVSCSMLRNLRDRDRDGELRFSFSLSLTICKLT